MRKLFLGAFALAFGFAASDAHAAYFYWKVAQEAGGYEFSYASLYDYATETTFNVGDSATAFAVGKRQCRQLTSFTFGVPEQSRPKR